MRKSLAFYLCLFLILAGCSKTSTSPSPQPLNPAGIYTVNYTEQSGGTCGPQSASTITITSVSSTFTWTEAGTTVNVGSMSCTADNCKTTVAGNVNVSQGGTTLTGPLSYSVTITSTGMTGTVVFTGTYTGAVNGACSSTYNVTGTKN